MGWFMAARNDVPGVIAPPPLIFLFFLLTGIGLDAVFRLALLPEAMSRPRWIAGVALIGVAIALLATGVAGFRRAGTPVPTRQPATALVTSGAHGFSRNPLYISLCLCYFGIALLANSVAAFALAIPLLLVIRYFVVAREERYLEHRFGDAYLAYKARVPRWLW